MLVFWECQRELSRLKKVGKRQKRKRAHDAPAIHPYLNMNANRCYLQTARRELLGNQR